MTLWDAAAHRPRAEQIQCMADRRLVFNPIFPVFAAVNRDDVLGIWSLETGAPLRALDFELGRRVRCACFSPDGLTCAVGGSNKQFAVFDVDL
jgi:WD40 repeat protein